MLLKSLVTFCFVVAVCWAKKSYDGYKVIEMNLKTDQEVKLVFQLSEKYLTDIWKGPSKIVSTHVMLSPENFQSFTNELNNHGISYTVMIENVENAVTAHEEDHIFSQLNMIKSSAIPNIHQRYPRTAEIEAWMARLAQTNSFVSVGKYGTTYENRNLKYIKISTGTNRKVILMDSGIHAREWLTIGTLIYMIDKIIDGYNNNEPVISEILSKYEFYFVPVFNPDGYEATHTRGNRLWRKNVTPHTIGYRLCYGVDLNRNFDIHFGGAGTSGDPCQDTYRGPKAFSEKETSYYRDFVSGIKNEVKLYIGLHSYAQFWFVPYGFSQQKAYDDTEMRRVANIGRDALASVNGVQFKVGTPPNILYAATGGAYDWMKVSQKVKYSYTLELQPKYGSSWNGQGFLAPVSLIKPSGEEVYAGLIATINAMK